MRVTMTESSLRSWLLLLLLVVALVCGGGTDAGGLGDLATQLLAIPMLAWALWPGDRRAPFPPVAMVWVALLAGFFIWQLLPIPAALALGWPARSAISSDLAGAGVDAPWHVALSPIAVERMAWSLLPCVAMFLSALRLDREDRRRLLQALVAIALVGVVLGVAQIANGPDTALRFYRPTHTFDAVGFFANRNHQSTLLVMCLALTLAAAAWETRQFLRQDASALKLAALIVVAVLLILGLTLARSRMGLALGMLTVLLCLPLAWRLRREGRRGIGRVGGIIFAISLVLVVQFGLVGVLQRLQADPLDDQRWQFAQTTLEAAREHAPLGTGLGGFVQAYQEVEGRGTPDPQIVNHAHDDYLELWLEGGWAAAAAVAIFLGLLAFATWRAWRTPPDRDGQLARAASIAAWTPLLHSLVDYPLRTTAASTAFALVLATLLMQGREPASVHPSGT